MRARSSAPDAAAPRRRGHAPDEGSSSVAAIDKQRRLAGAVRPEQRDDFSGAQSKRHLVEHAATAEVTGNVREGQRAEIHRRSCYAAASSSISA